MSFKERLPAFDCRHTYCNVAEMAGDVAQCRYYRENRYIVLRAVACVFHAKRKETCRGFRQLMYFPFRVVNAFNIHMGALQRVDRKVCERTHFGRNLSDSVNGVGGKAAGLHSGCLTVHF